MIVLTLKELEETYYLKAVGHSGKKNESIVCASVSVLLETWRIAEEVLENQEISYKDGFLEAHIPKTMTSQILFIQLSLGLSAITQQYPNDISLTIGG